VILETIKEGSVDLRGEIPAGVLRREAAWIARQRQAGDPLLNDLDHRHRTLIRREDSSLVREAHQRGRSLVAPLT
jgi:hypothetical protein